MNRFVFCMAFVMLSLNLSAQELSEKSFELAQFTHGISFIPMLNIDRAPAFPFGFNHDPGLAFGLGYQLEKRIKAQFSWSIIPHVQYSKNRLTINSIQDALRGPITFDNYQTQLGELKYQDVSLNLPFLLNFYSEAIPLHFSMGLSFNAHITGNNDWTYDLIELTQERPDEFTILETGLQDDFESRVGELKFVFGGGYNTRRWNFDLLVNLGSKAFINRLGYGQGTFSFVGTYKW